MTGEEHVSPDRIIGVLYALDHGEFAEVLVPEAAEQYRESLQAIVDALRQSGGGEFMTQLFLPEAPDQLADPNTISWFAIKNTVIIDSVNDAGVIFKPGHRLFRQPLDCRDLIDVPGLKELPVISIEFGSILPGFDHMTYLPSAE